MGSGRAVRVCGERQNRRCAVADGERAHGAPTRSSPRRCCTATARCCCAPQPPTHLEQVHRAVPVLGNDVFEGHELQRPLVGPPLLRGAAHAAGSQGGAQTLGHTAAARVAAAGSSRWLDRCRGTSQQRLPARTKSCDNGGGWGAAPCRSTYSHKCAPRRRWPAGHSTEGGTDSWRSSVRLSLPCPVGQAQ